MASEATIVLVQGRIVWVAGNLFSGELETIFGTNQAKIDPKTGKQNTVFRFGLAVPKAELADPQRGAIWAAMHTEARGMYPSGQIPQGFAWKYKDGDGLDDRGKPFSQREGYAGCLVFTMATNIQPRFFRWEGGQNVQVADGIKCGDYVNVQVNIGSQSSAKPGLYLNPMAVQLVAPGKEIINMPTGDNIFGAPPPPPQGYVPPEQPAMPAAAMPMAPPMPQPQVAPAAPQAPQAHYAVVPPQFQPPAGGMPMAPSMPQPQVAPAYGGGLPPIPR